MPAQASLAIKPSLTLKRRLNAPPEKVYAAWTDPEKVLKWFGPDAGPVMQAEIDVRVGGRYAVTFHTEDGEQHHVSGVYLIKPDGDGSLLTLIHEQFFDEPARDRHREGWTGCLDKLERFLA